MIRCGHGASSELFVLADLGFDLVQVDCPALATAGGAACRLCFEALIQNPSQIAEGTDK